MEFKTKNLKKLPAAVFTFWMKYYKYFFILLFLAALGYGAFVWYDTFYLFRWSDEEKQQYTITKNRNINLKEKEFNSMIEEINERKQKFEAPVDKIKDIFKSE